jgi:hypothetical protein
MAPINTISVQIVTSNLENAGTDGDVYLGICGREFYLDSGANDFERGSNRIYILGEGSNIENRDANNPRKPQLNTDHLGNFPVYIRFDPQGNSPDWNLSFVSVEVGGANFGVNLPGGLWLGRKSGKFCYLRRGKFSE